MKDASQFKSDISQIHFSVTEKVDFKLLRPNIKSYILKDYPSLNEHSLISIGELNFISAARVTNNTKGVVKNYGLPFIKP